MYGIIHKIDRAEIIRLWKETRLSQRDIATETGHGAVTVAKVLEKAGLIDRRKIWERFYTEEEFRALVVDQANWPEIQRVTGYCQRMLYRYRKIWSSEEV